MAKINKLGNRWEVNGDVTVSYAPALLVESFNLPMAESLVIDMAQVSHVDTATISLIFEWLRHAQAKKCDLRFANFPKNLLSLITLYGVVDLIPQVAH